MVPVEKDNAYQLREYLHQRVIEGTHADPFKSFFLHFLGLSKNRVPSFDFSTLSLYQRCAIAGLGILEKSVSSQDVSRLLGQAAKIDSTPRPWVSDIRCCMAPISRQENRPQSAATRAIATSFSKGGCARSSRA
jgi:hypothetical protein